MGEPTATCLSWPTFVLPLLLAPDFPALSRAQQPVKTLARLLVRAVRACGRSSSSSSVGRERALHRLLAAPGGRGPLAPNESGASRARTGARLWAGLWAGLWTRRWHSRRRVDPGRSRGHGPRWCLPRDSSACPHTLRSELRVAGAGAKAERDQGLGLINSVRRGGDYEHDSGATREGRL